MLAIAQVGVFVPLEPTGRKYVPGDFLSPCDPPPSAKKKKVGRRKGNVNNIGAKGKKEWEREKRTRAKRREKERRGGRSVLIHLHSSSPPPPPPPPVSFPSIAKRENSLFSSFVRESAGGRRDRVTVRLPPPPFAGIPSDPPRMILQQPSALTVSRSLPMRRPRPIFFFDFQQRKKGEYNR